MMEHRPKERTRPYDTSEPNSLGDVLSQLFAARGFGRVQGDRQLQEMWQSVVADNWPGQTRVLGLRNGVLQIGVRNAALLSELASFHKEELLSRIRNEHPRFRVRDLKFRLRGDIG